MATLRTMVCAVAIILISVSFNLAFCSNDATTSSDGNILTTFGKRHCTTDSTKHWQIAPFVEIAGKGFISVNVDFRPNKKFSFSLGLQPFEGLLPDVMGYYLVGNRHSLEIGTGISLGFSRELDMKAILLHGSLGYRYQKKKGLFFRVGFTPLYTWMFDDNERTRFYPLPGLSLGYSF
jgi:hypothetical protein